MKATTWCPTFFLLYGNEPSGALDTILPCNPDAGDNTTVLQLEQHTKNVDNSSVPLQLRINTVKIIVITTAQHLRL